MGRVSNERIGLCFMGAVFTRLQVIVPIGTSHAIRRNEAQRMFHKIRTLLYPFVSPGHYSKAENVPPVVEMKRRPFLYINSAYSIRPLRGAATIKSVIQQSTAERPTGSEKSVPTFSNTLSGFWASWKS